MQDLNKKSNKLEDQSSDIGSQRFFPVKRKPHEQRQTALTFKKKGSRRVDEHYAIGYQENHSKPLQMPGHYPMPDNLILPRNPGFQVIDNPPDVNQLI